MAGLRLMDIDKSFGDTQVLAGIALDIAPGEFVAVLGPSGCGKTTLLRLIAGFETPDRGTIHLGNRLVADGRTCIAPEDRGIGIVFQNYALWPHMSVADNVGYALKVAGLPRVERRARIDHALQAVNLTPFAQRRPADLSGGQRQRVALARCLAARSSLILLDEPLANLDVHLRATMEEEFRRFHRDSGATLLYITHDQSEAMAMADRIAVMDRGRLLQCASPRSLYREPACTTVAGFIGQGIVLPVENLRPIAPGRAEAEFLGITLALRCHAGETARAVAAASTHPADIRQAKPGEPAISARVTGCTYRGGHWSLELRPDGDPDLRLPMTLVESDAPPPETGQAVAITLTDMWAIPQSGASAQGTAPFPTNTTRTEQFQCV